MLKDVDRSKYGRIRLNCWSCFIKLVGLVFIGGSTARAQDAPLLLDDFIESMHFERTKLRSGDCKITGQRTSNQAGAELDTPLDIRFVFDFASNLVFVDETSTIWLGKDIQHARRIALRSEDLLLQYSSTNRAPRVVISQYSQRFQSRASNVRGIMDIRALGLAPSSFFKGGLNYSLQDIEARMIRRSELLDTYTLQRLEQGIFVIVGRASQSISRLRVFVDSERGYTPFRMVSDSVIQDAITGETRVTDFLGQADVGWKEESGVWIPTYCEWINNRNTIPDGKEDKLENVVRDQQTEKWQFEWYSVNEPLDENFWSYRNWNLPSDVVVFDFSKDEKGVFIERIGDGPRQIELQKAIANKRIGFFWFNVALLTIAFAAGVIWLFMRYRNRQP